MINFEYGGYTFEYNEFQHKLEVKCDGEELLLDAYNFDLGRMPEIYEHLNNYYNFRDHANNLGEVLNTLRHVYLSLQEIEKTEEVYEFLISQAQRELDEIDTWLGGYEVDED